MRQTPLSAHRQISTHQLSTSESTIHLWSWARCSYCWSVFCNCEHRVAHNWDLLQQAGLGHLSQGFLVNHVFWIFPKAYDLGLYILALDTGKAEVKWLAWVCIRKRFSFKSLWFCQQGGRNFSKLPTPQEHSVNNSPYMLCLHWDWGTQVTE